MGTNSKRSFDKHLKGKLVDFDTDLGDGLGSLFHLRTAAHLQETFGLSGGILQQDYLRSVFHTGDIKIRRRIPVFALVDELLVERVEASALREELLELAEGGLGAEIDVKVSGAVLNADADVRDWRKCSGAGVGVGVAFLDKHTTRADLPLVDGRGGVAGDSRR